MQFSPGCCCDTKPEAVCVYTGKYSDAKLLQLLDTDYRADSTRPVPWYYWVSGNWRPIHAWPAIPGPDDVEPPEPSGPPPCYALYSRQWTIPVEPAIQTPQFPHVTNGGLDAASFYSMFHDGLTPALAAGGLGGSAWSRLVVPIGYTSNDLVGTELPYHTWYLQIFLYSTRADAVGFGATTVPWSMSGIRSEGELIVFPLDHNTGTGSAFYPAVCQRARNAKYMSVALVPWSTYERRVCLTDCGLYQCNCAHSGSIRQPKVIRPYGTLLSSLDGQALADELGEAEIYPNGNYYLTVSTNPVEPRRFDNRIGGGWIATDDHWIFPTAEDFRLLDALRWYLQDGNPTTYYCGLYQCGRALVVEGGQTEVVPEGTLVGYGRLGMDLVSDDTDYTHYNVSYPYPVTAANCPTTWPGPTNCRWATTTARKWLHCSSCRVVECRCPAALVNGVSDLGVGHARDVPGADYAEVRSGVCNASACRHWQL